MDILKIFQKFDGQILNGFPAIDFSNLYKHVINNFYFEFFQEDEKHLFSPYYSFIRGRKLPDLLEFVSKNELFLDSLKMFVISSLYIYGAIIEENSYYLLKPQSILIARFSYCEQNRFEIKFYTHYEEELLNNYTDKIYIGRHIVDLDNFHPEYLGLKETFNSLLEQNKKIQDRAEHKLRYLKDYKKPYLDEIEYMIKEAVDEAMERIQIMPEKTPAKMSKIKLNEILDNVLYLQNLMIELIDFAQEFENILRLREENQFVKYLTKFSKDLASDLSFLKKISMQLQYKLSNQSLF